MSRRNHIKRAKLLRCRSKFAVGLTWACAIAADRYWTSRNSVTGWRIKQRRRAQQICGGYK